MPRMIEFGVTARKLSEQINGATAQDDEHSRMITRLMVHGIVTGDEAHKAYGRLLKIISKRIKKGGAG
jgi:hypothetical protein